MRTLTIGFLILCLAFIIPTVVAENIYCLNPTDSSVSQYCETTEVEVWVKADEPIQGGTFSIDYTFCCANITKYEPNTAFFEDQSPGIIEGKLTVGYAHWDGGPTNQDKGEYLLGNFTIHCCNQVTDYCKTDLLLKNCMLNQIVSGMPPSIIKLPFSTENGTFECGTPACEPCLGDCYDANGVLVASNVPCYDCLYAQGIKWVNYPCPVSASGCTCPSMEWEECPQCCDGVDNDNPADGLIDWPNDPKCGCCIDPDETNGDDPCPTPCVPELPTIALMSIGVLGMLLLVRKRG